MNPTQALKLICDGIIESLKTNPAGTPEGLLYAILMTQGCTLEQFEAIIKALCDAGMIRKQGNLLFA
jgi:hypothetical protein